MTSISIGSGSSVLAFDVGGTDIKVALVDGHGTFSAVQRVPTPVRASGSEHAVLDEVERLADALIRRHPSIAPAAAGLAVPGLVDDDAGIGRYSENLFWNDVPFRELAQARLGLPVAFTHDVRAAGEAEYRIGSARAFSNVLVVVIGTGISSAVFIEGRPYVAHGYAGEIGHAVVDRRGEPCACGGRGCVEAIASAASIARRYNRAASASVAGAKEVLERASAGDPIAKQIWESAVDALALGLSHSIALLAPEAIVIGGGLAQAGDALFTPLEAGIDGYLSFHARPRLLAAGIGENAGLVGTALRARDLAESGA